VEALIPNAASMMPGRVAFLNCSLQYFAIAAQWKHLLKGAVAQPE
jgi:hypothetical protein